MKLPNWISLFCLLSVPCTAVEWDSSWGVDAGFRYDELSVTTKAYNLAGELILIEDLDIGSLHTLTCGVNGIITANRNWFIKGNADVGTIVGGTYFETVIDFGADHTKARVHDGYTKDFSVGLGYLAPLTDNVSLGPVGGWSYDFLSVTIHNAKEDGVPDPTLDGLSYNSMWRGPWLGICGDYTHGALLFSAGYEYHWADWEANWLLKGEDQPGGPFLERRTANHAHGHVVYGKVFFNLNNGWDFTAGVNYQDWTAKNGEAKPRAGSFAAVGLPNTASEKVSKSTWRPLQITLGCNYRF